MATQQDSLLAPPLPGATNGDDTLVGTAGNDVMDGLAGNDRMSGLAGNDRMSGGPGDDTMDGGSGADRMDGGNGADTLFGDGESPNLEDRDLPSDDILFGGNGNDNIVGGWGSNTIDGGPGNDTLSAAWGGVTFFTPGSHTTIDGGSGDDVIVGSTQGETLYGGEGNDRIIGIEGDDLIFGGPGNDYINWSGFGVAVLDGGTGDDVMGGGIQGTRGDETPNMYGGQGDDTLVLGFNEPFAPVIDGGSGFDKLSLGAGFSSGQRLVLDLGGTVGENMSHIEKIDMSGDFGGQSLIATDTDRVVTLAESSDVHDTLFVDGDVGDKVFLSDSFEPAGTQTVDGTTYNEFTFAGVSLLVDTDMSINFATT